jgi:ABC-type multidrug transport system ATPase subunit
VQPTSGSIKIAGYDVTKQFEQARKLIGYCPQPNLIFDHMSVEEHLYYYAKIKGIPSKKRPMLVEQAI